MATYILGMALLLVLAINVTAVGMMAVAFASIIRREGCKATIYADSWTPPERKLMRAGAGVGVLTAIMYFVFFAAAEHFLGIPNPLW